MPETLYEQDFVLWTEKTARAIREGRFEALDRENLAEEIESLGRSDRRALESHLVVLVAHALKWQYQPERRGGSWYNTIRAERLAIEKLIEESPSLKRHMSLEQIWSEAKLRAEIDAPFAHFPDACPFALNDLLEPDFPPAEQIIP